MNQTNIIILSSAFNICTGLILHDIGWKEGYSYHKKMYEKIYNP